MDQGGGLEIDWRTFTGGHDLLYINLARYRAAKDGVQLDDVSLKHYIQAHVHRGIVFLLNLDFSHGEESIAHHLILADEKHSLDHVSIGNS